MSLPAWRLRSIVTVGLVMAAAIWAGESFAEAEESQSSAIGPAPQISPPAASAVPDSAHSHVAVLVLENKEYGEVIGNPAAPYLNSLARHYALATRYFGVTHPSLPNYLALTAGTTFGVTRDCTGCSFGGPNLMTQLSSAGFSWRSYVGGVPGSCYLGARATRYVKALNPFAYLRSITESAPGCSNVVPLSNLSADLQVGNLPDFSWITPDLCQDTHHCSVSTGDRFLSQLVPPLVKGLGPHGALFILWDEGDSNRGLGGTRNGGGHVPAIVVGPDVRPGTQIKTPMNQYASLREIESAFGLPPLRHARSVPPHTLRSVFTRDLRIRPSAGLPGSGGKPG
jgi:phosphatidylinositol-3-phosphatase